jgi:hypothetical protein
LSLALHTPGKHRPRPADRNVTIDAFDMSVIRQAVQEFHATQTKVLSCHKLVMKQKIGFPWDLVSLRNILRNLRFKCKNASVSARS